MVPKNTKPLPHEADWRHKLHEVIFEAETRAGKTFDIALLFLIFTSVIVVMLDSVESIRAEYHDELYIAEWVFTILFSIEYILRLLCTRRAFRYATSFYGIIDFVAVLPTYLALMISETAPSIMVLRALRLLRTFRVFKLVHVLKEASALRAAIIASRAKIAVFLAVVIILVVIAGSAMYVIEGDYPETGFTSIPQSVYWAIVTMTTVGYGDISPHTPLGEAVAACMMLVGYSMIIVPTGIVSAEMASANIRRPSSRSCHSCLREGHESDAIHCKYCGAKLSAMTMVIPASRLKEAAQATQESKPTDSNSS